jgi:hypothetical protein
MRVGLFGASRIQDSDARYTQADQSQAHCHSMVSVRLHVRCMQLAWMDCQTVLMLVDFGTDATQFASKVANPIGFLMSVVSDTSYSRRAFCKQGYGG